jgi:hypothetical protein
VSADVDVDRTAQAPAGTHHAVVLTLCIVVPLATAAGRAARLRIEGFPTWTYVALAATISVAYGLLAVVGSRAGHRAETPGVAAARPSIGGIAARLLAAALLAVGVRLTVPSPSRALAEVRDGDAYLVSGTALLVFVTVVVGAMVGQVVTTRAVALARGQTTVAVARATDRQVIVSAWGTGVVLSVVAGLTRGSGGLAGQLLALGAIVVAVGVIGDLRSRIPPPGGLRPPIVEVVPQVRGRALAVALATAVLATALVMPLLPGTLYDGLGRPSEWLANLEYELDPVRTSSPGRGGELDQILDRLPIESYGLPDWPELRDLRLPGWLQGVAVALIALAGLAVLRPDRWAATWRRLFSALRWRGWPVDDEGFERLDPLEDETSGSRTARDRLRGAFERVRPRPRDPRQAIVHDYLRIDRLLGREGLDRRASETPLEHAERVAATRDDDGFGALRDLAALVSAARYGATAPDTAASERSRELHQRLEQALR